MYYSELHNYGSPRVHEDTQNKCAECGLVWTGLQAFLCYECSLTDVLKPSTNGKEETEDVDLR